MIIVEFKMLSPLPFLFKKKGPLAIIGNLSFPFNDAGRKIKQFVL
jgi:hypothetical protein